MDNFSAKGLEPGLNRFPDFEDVVALTADQKLVLDQQRNELLPVHERDRGCAVPGGLLIGFFGKVAGGDDESLFVDAQAAPELLHGIGLDVVFPLLCLHGHAGADDIADQERAPHVDAAVLGVGGDFDFFESDAGEQFADQFLEGFGMKRLQSLQEFGADGPVVLLDIKSQPGSLPCGEADEAPLAGVEAGLLTPGLVTPDLREDLRIHGRLGCLAFGVE